MKKTLTRFFILIVAILTFGTTVIFAGPGEGKDEVRLPIIILPIDLCPCDDYDDGDEDDDDDEQ